MTARHRFHPAIAAFVLLATAGLSTSLPAQGFPGGGAGGGRGGHGGPHGSHGGTPRPVTPNEQRPGDPLAGFAESLRALREELLLREDQAPAWTAMRDALHAYVDIEHQRRDAAAKARDADPPIDPLARLATLADDTRSRADASRQVSDSMAVLVAALDVRQKQAFLARLAESLAQKD